VTGGWPIVLVWLYLMGWSSYATEVCATFAPEYVDTKKDTPLALRSSSLFNLIVFFMLPLGVVGTLTAAQVAGKDGSNAAGGYLVDAMRRIVGGGSTGLLLMFVIAGLLLSMNTATMDGSRALYGISQDGMTVKGLGRLNRHHVPGNAMTTDAVMNILLVLAFQNTLAILAASNLGYILSHVAALTAVILLRMDRPRWPRPIKLPSFWIGLAGVLAAANMVFIVVGFWKFGDTGYAGTTKWLGIHNELWIGVGILVIGVVLFIYRRVVQDKGEIHFRDPEAPDVPAPSASIPAPAPAR
jgi:amino acid transporter